MKDFDDRKKHIEEKEINSLSDFFAVIEEVKKVLNSELGLFYRGQRDYDWNITSSLQRYIKQCDTDEKKKTLLNQIYNRYVIFKSFIPQYQYELLAPEYILNSDINTLALAQHHGFPTRLVDWSLNPLVSLYFAVENSDTNSKNAAVFCFNIPCHLTGDEFEKGHSVSISNWLEKHYKENQENFDIMENGKLSSFKYRNLSTHDLDSFTKENCIGLTLPFFDKNMVAQQGVFTITKNINFEFEKEQKNQIIKLNIAKPYQIKKELTQINIVTSSIYPSLSGLCISQKSILDNFITPKFTSEMENS